MIFRTVFIMINYLQQKNIPHNIFITRALAKDLNNADLNNSRNCVRVFIWARTFSGKIYFHKTYLYIIINYYLQILKFFIISY